MVKILRSKLSWLAVAAWLCATAACSKSGSSADPQPGADKGAEAAKGAEPAAEPAEPAEPAGITYERSEGGAVTTVRVSKQGGELKFTITARTPGGACDTTIEGVAKEKEGDMESRDDDKGEGHFVAEYVYESESCGASVSIDNAAQTMAWVAAWDCKQLKDDCELPSGPLTRK